MPSSQQQQHKKQTFVAWCPDYADASASKRRAELFKPHMVSIKRNLQSGVLRPGSGYTVTADSVGKPLRDVHANGSMMVFEAESIEEVRALVQADAYWTGDVWDKEKVDIRPIIIMDAKL